MINPNRIEGLSVRCSGDGIILSVLFNTIEPGVLISLGSSLFDLISGSDGEKIRDEIFETQSSGALYMMSIGLHTGISVIPLYWSGSRFQNEIILVATRDRADLRLLFQAVTENAINSDESIEEAVTRKIRDREKKGGEQWEEYQRFSELNNQLLNTQRDLAKTIQQLRESRDTYRITLASITDAVISTDWKGIINFANNTFSEITGVEPVLMVGKSLSDVMLQFCDQKSETLIAVDHIRLLNGSIPSQFFPDVIFKHQTGSCQLFEVQATPIRTDGDIIGIVITCRDVTGERNLVEALTGINKRINLLTSITRHDILNALTVAILIGDMIGNSDSIPQIRKYISDQKEPLGMINRLISFTRVYEEIGVYSASWQLLSTLIRTAMENLHFNEITVSIHMDDIEVYADPMLGKVFYNLLENALRHGGKLTMIEGRYEIKETDLVIYFLDDGQGVPDQYKEAIFNREYYSHTGFGLNLSREILAITGISITESGVHGKGARFEIQVPRGKWRIAGQ